MNLDLEKIEQDLSKLADIEQETGIDGYDDIIVDEYHDNDDDDYDDKYNDNDNSTSNNNSLDTSNLFGVPDVANVWKKNKKG